MNRNRKMAMNLRMFDGGSPASNVPQNQNQAADFAPAISIDFTSRITENIQTLQTILGITSMTPMNAGSLIKMYKYKTIQLAQQVAEGEVIPLTKVERILAKTIELPLGKHRRQTTAEAIQKHGREPLTKLIISWLQRSVVPSRPISSPLSAPGLAMRQPAQLFRQPLRTSGALCRPTTTTWM